MLITMLYIMQHISKLPHYYSVVPKEIINFATFLNQNRKNMKAFVFPGQGAQFVGMGKDLYENSALAKELFEKANDILGYRITDIMFEGTDEDLRQTKVTQPAVFLHSVISALCMGDDFKPEMTAGHSLGEFSALVAAGALSFEVVGATAHAARACQVRRCDGQFQRASRSLSCGGLGGFCQWICERPPGAGAFAIYDPDRALRQPGGDFR